MSLTADSQPKFGRFAPLLGGERRWDAPYDHVLLETAGCVVTPTLGSILPNWLLLVPKVPAVNFARWAHKVDSNPAEVVDAVLTYLDISPERAIWFEHGPAEAGSIVGCGVDHAHIHVIIDAPFSFREFGTAIDAAGDLTWQRTDATSAYSRIKPDVSYLFACSENRAMLAERVERVGSQYFRRLIATLAQRADEWDYKIHPHLDNVRRTIQTFERHNSR